MTVQARPFLKWAGGKTKLLQPILGQLPQRISTYYEPFLGGGAVFFALAAEGRFDRAVLSDTNMELIRAWQAVARKVDALVKELRVHTLLHEEKGQEHYYHVRSLEPRSMSLVKRAARTIYLNKTCFNGLYRVNKRGEFNVPMGRYVDPVICDEENLRAVAHVLRNRVQVERIDFTEAMQHAGRQEGAAAYLDPPYLPTNKTSSFTSYTGDGFGLDDHRRIAQTIRESNGLFVLLSEPDLPAIRDVFDGYETIEVQAPRSINSKGSKRGNVSELLIRKE